MKCILFGGSGEVGGAVTRALIASDACTQLTLLNRRQLDTYAGEAKVEQLIVDTEADDFEQTVARLAKGHTVGISCIGVGEARNVPEAELLAIEVDLVGAYARGCKAAGIEIFELLTAVGIHESKVDASFKYTRVISRKLKTVLDVGFAKLAVFEPGMIVGNKHTPGWLVPLTSWIPDSWGFGNIHQDQIGVAFAGHLQHGLDKQQEQVVRYGNKEMKAF